MNRLNVAVLMALMLMLILLVACEVDRPIPPTLSLQTAVLPTPTITPTPPPNAKFSIGAKVYLKSETFTVFLADEPHRLADEAGVTQVCYANYLPTVLTIVQKDGVVYYLLDCGGIAKGWLPEDKLDVEPGR